MQVQHECQLIEPLIDWGSRPLSSSLPLQPLDEYTLNHQNVVSALNPIEYLSSAPNFFVLACYLESSKQICIFDTKTRQQRDRFPLKACDKKYSRQSFTIRGLAFSPDSTRLAVGQTDCIIYIYKLPINNFNVQQQQETTQGPHQKVAISGKFVCSSPITCLIWEEAGILFGTQDGKIKLISFGSKPRVAGTESLNSSTTTESQATTNNQQPKVISLYASPKGAMPLCLAYKNPFAIVGFLDGTIIVLCLPAEYHLNLGSTTTITTTTILELADPGNNSRRNSGMVQIPPGSLATVSLNGPVQRIKIINNNQANSSFLLCSSSQNGKLNFHETQWDNNKGLRLIERDRVELGDEIQALDYCQINELIVVATIHRLCFLRLVDSQTGAGSWRPESKSIELDGALSLTSVLCTKDGSQIVAGTLIGSLELFQCVWTKESIGEQLDICHIAKNRVRISDRSRNLLATYKTEHDIKRVNVLDGGRSVIIWTSGSSLLLARLTQSDLQSEIKLSPSNYNASSGVLSSTRTNSSSRNSTRYPPLKFLFDFSGLVLIYNEQTREVQIVKLGCDSILHSIKLAASSVISFNRRTVSIRQYPSGDELLMQEAKRLQEYNSITTLNHGLNSNISSLQKQQFAAVKQQQQQRHRLAYISPDNHANLYLISDLKSVVNTMIAHKLPLVAVEFSLTSDNLIFLDSQQNLYVMTYSTASGFTEPTLMVDKCNFASWLPQSEILVAQCEHEIIVSYEVNQLISKQQKKPIQLNRIDRSKVSSISYQVFDARTFNSSGVKPLIDLSQVDIIRSSRDMNQSTISKKSRYPVIKKIGSDCAIRLSNGMRINLDPIRVKFFSQLMSSSIKSALEVLEAAGFKSSQRPLWIKLLWLALEKSECSVVIKAMSRLGYKSSWIEYMQECLTDEEEGDHGIEQLIKLSLIKGDWEKFERIAEPEVIQATYRRMNKWTKLLDYLARMQQFRQRDLAELDYRQWLIARGRHLDAAKLTARQSGDMAGALDLLIAANQHIDAAQLLLAETISHNNNNNSSSPALNFVEDPKISRSLDQIHSELMRLEKFNLAARICHYVTRKLPEALNLYVRAHNFEPAIELAIELSMNERLPALHEAYANHLVDCYKSRLLAPISNRQAPKAIDQFMKAGKKMLALKAALDLRELDKAHQMIIDPQGSFKLQSLESEDDKKLLVDLSLCLGRELEKEAKLQEAVDCLLTGGHPMEACNLWIAHARYDLAFKTALDHIHSNDKSKAVVQFEKLANELVSNVGSQNQAAHLKAAEEIYVKILDKPQLAIELQRRLRNFDRMLELVAEYEPDQLESQLLLVAKEFENQGQLDRAEAYLLRVSSSEWTNVVRMYRLAGDWKEAFRVAREHCSSSQDPLLIQLAFWWSRSLNNIEKSCELLTIDLNLLEPVIEFCCENKSYNFAMELCDSYLTKGLDDNNHENYATSDRKSEMLKLRREVVRRQATQLEQQNKFFEAEQVLVESGYLEDAVKMYLDNDKFNEAIRIIEQEMESTNPTRKVQLLELHLSADQLTELLSKTLIESGKRLSQEVPLSDNNKLANNPTSFTNSKGLVSPTWQAKLLQAQQFYLRAQRPDLAIFMYQERAMWKEAVQLAQRYAPKLLEQVELALDSAVSEDLEAPSLEDNLDNTALTTTTNPVKQKPSTKSEISAKSDISDLVSTIQTDSGVVSEIQEALGRKTDILMEELSNLMGDSYGAITTLSSFIDSLLSQQQIDISMMSRARHSPFAIQMILISLQDVLSSQIVFALIRNIRVARGEESDHILARSLAQFGDRFLETCGWGLPTNQEEIHQSNWSQWLNILAILDEHDYGKMTLYSTARMFAKEVNHYCKLLSQLVSILSKNNNSIVNDNKQQSIVQSSTRKLKIGGHLRNHQKTSNQMNSNSTKLKISPSNAVDISKNSSTKDIAKQLAQHSLNILTLKSNQVHSIKHQQQRRQEFDLIAFISYLSGLWLIAAGSPDKARKLWSQLVELIDHHRHQAPINLKPMTGNNQNKKGFKIMKDHMIQEVRSWLIEGLLNIQSTGGSDSHEFTLPDLETIIQTSQ